MNLFTVTLYDSGQKKSARSSSSLQIADVIQGLMSRLSKRNTPHILAEVRGAALSDNRSIAMRLDKTIPNRADVHMPEKD